MPVIVPPIRAKNSNRGNNENILTFFMNMK